jgi:ribosomal protein L37E
MTWDGRSILGAVVVVGASFSALVLILVPTPTAQIGLLLIAPVVAWISAPGSRRKEYCSHCGVARQLHRVYANSTVSPATQVVTHSGNVEVLQGWEVATPVSEDCKKCGAGRRYQEIKFVPRSLAPSAGEAVIHARLPKSQ